MPSIFEDVTKVERDMPPGTTLLHKPTGVQYIIGAKYKVSEFWIMRVRPAGRTTVPARQIVKDFEVVSE